MEVAAREMGVDLDASRTRSCSSTSATRPSGRRSPCRRRESAEFAVDLPARGSVPAHVHPGRVRGADRAVHRPQLDQCRAALRDAELTPAQIDEVVLVGGSTRIPYVRRRVGEFFGRTPHTELNPDEVVALGAAVQADILTGGRRRHAAARRGAAVARHRDARRRRGQADPPQHAPSRPGRRRATPPSATTRRRSCINIYQGERELTKDCRLLGTFKLAGIPPMPAQFAAGGRDVPRGRRTAC